jgi:hypothetical protein
MMQCRWQQWHPWPMVVVAIAVIILNCAAAVDAAATIQSLALMAVAKIPLLPPPLTASSIDGDCCHCHQRPPLPLPHSQR